MSKIRKISMVVGGSLLAMIAGNIDIIGTISPYIASYFYQNDPSVRDSDFTIILGISCISEALTTILISYLVSYLNTYYVMMIVSSISSIVLIFTSFITNPFAFCCVFGICIGSLSAALLWPSIWILWSHMPEYKSIVSGVIFSFYSIGSLPFGICFTYLANPSDVKASYLDNENDETMFGDNVASRVIWSLRIICFAYLGTIILGFLLIPKEMETEEEETSNRKLTFREMICDFKFWNLYFFCFFSMGGFFYIIGLYKIIGLIFIDDDHYLSFIGVASFASSGIGESVIGYLLHRFQWHIVVAVNLGLGSIIFSSLWFVLRSKAIYGIYIILFRVFGSSFFNSIVVKSEIDFPGDKNIVSYLNTPLIFITFIGYISENSITPYIGYFYTFIIISIFYIIGIFQVFFHPKLLQSSQGLEEESKNMIEVAKNQETDIQSTSRTRDN